MPLRRHRLPRFWLALTLGSLAIAVGGVYWWERQLPRRLAEAVASGRVDDCLRYSEQLAALRWLPGRAPQDEGQCRREKARQLWEQERWAPALTMQRQLVNSSAGTPADRQKLTGWQEELRRLALTRFRAGDLEGALAALAPMGEHHRADGRAIGDELRANWNSNRLQNDRAAQLVSQERWWEALDSLNRIDHPWWQTKSQPLRDRVQEALSKLKEEDREHHSHGELPHTVPTDRLDALIQRRIAGGMDEWQAFQEACTELGGRVVEAGPESACQR